MLDTVLDMWMWIFEVTARAGITEAVFNILFVYFIVMLIIGIVKVVTDD